MGWVIKGKMMAIQYIGEQTPLGENWLRGNFDPVLVDRCRVRATKCDALAKLCGVQKNRYGHNFQNIGSIIRLLIGYEPTLICFGSDILTIATVTVHLNTENT